MSEKKPESKPAAPGSAIPVGKLVAGKAAKPPAAKVKPPEVIPTLEAVSAPPPNVPVAPVGDYDVELVAVPCPPPQKPRKPGDSRSLVDLDRRDFIMLGAGVGGSMIAVLSGLILAKLLQRKPPEEIKGDEPKADPKNETAADPPKTEPIKPATTGTEKPKPTTPNKPTNTASGKPSPPKPN